MTGILFALTAALFWGSGDFSGGFSTRNTSPFQVLALSAIAGIVILATVGLVAHVTLPPAIGIFWSLLAGLSGAVGNVFFLLAITFSRLDFAVIISSLYPAVTVLLAGFILKEKVCN